jgi:hypothetical protein
MKKSFDAVDIDGSRQIDVNEFMFSLMGEKAQNYGVLADLEVLNNLLNTTAELLVGLQGGVAASAESAESRAKRNAELKERLKEMKKNMDGSLGKVIGSMMSMMGVDPEDILTDEEVTKLLSETFKKFDKDGSGALEKKEFFKAWDFLGLKGSQSEIENSYNGVDTDDQALLTRWSSSEPSRGFELKNFLSDSC